MPRPTWAATPSTRRTSDSVNSRPVRHHTRKIAPTGSPRTVVGANSTEWDGIPSSDSASKRGSAWVSPLQAARPARHAGTRSGKRERGKWRVVNRSSRSLGT